MLLLLIPLKNSEVASFKMQAHLDYVIQYREIQQKCKFSRLIFATAWYGTAFQSNTISMSESLMHLSFEFQIQSVPYRHHPTNLGVPRQNWYFLTSLLSPLGQVRFS